jgi:enoyl-CoA hydratase/carnithine racemase
VTCDSPRAGRGRALEVLLSADDYDAELAERYGWINRAVPAVALASADDFRRDSDLFGEGVGHPETQARIRTAMERGLQTREAEIDLGGVIG